MSLSTNLSNKPHRRLLAIGDIHGCRDKLQHLVKVVQPTAEDRLVFLGDYIDRGDDSPGVVETLIALQKEADCVFLRGNHEQMLLDYVDETDDIFLLNGGTETLQQYKNSRWGKIPEHHVEFFRCLKYLHRQDGFIFVHAGLRPEVRLEGQQQFDLLWIRTEFLNSDYSWGDTVVFGHSPVTEPVVRVERIGLDTGVVFPAEAGYGKLTCCDLYSRRFWSV